MAEANVPPLITAPGAYPGIDEADYHRNPNLLPGPSLSASGAKTLIGRSPFHFWADSPLNPDRPEPKDTQAFRIGRAAHDLLLLPERWATHYHVLPEGYKAPDSRTKNFKPEQIEHLAAKEAGKTILRHTDLVIIQGVAEAIGMHRVAMLTMTAGEPEVTLVWQDKETGIWCRCRPDHMPNSVRSGGDVRAVTDLKFMAPENASPHGFSRAIGRFGYHMAAAHYSDGIEAVFGRRPTHWIHLVVEKDFPFSVSIYTLPEADLARGRHQMKIARQRFADCLAADKWPSYADEPTEVGLDTFNRRTIDQFGTAQDAALINANEGA